MCIAYEHDLHAFARNSYARLSLDLDGGTSSTYLEARLCRVVRGIPVSSEAFVAPPCLFISSTASFARLASSGGVGIRIPFLLIQKSIQIYSEKMLGQND